MAGDWCGSSKVRNDLRITSGMIWAFRNPCISNLSYFLHGFPPPTNILQLFEQVEYVVINHLPRRLNSGAP